MGSEDDDSAWMVPGSSTAASGNGDNAQTGNRSSRSDSAPSALNRFEIIRRIGEGGMGVVYEAQDRQKSELVAIKLIHAELLNNEDLVRQFSEEASVATSLSHPNIVNVFDVHVVEGQRALSMERLQGRTLRTAIREQDSSGSRFGTNDAVQAIDYLCRALIYAHDYTIHRDVKPENIWLGDDGTVKLMDFGLARLARPGRGGLQTATLTKLHLGSPYYMAPEQIRQDASADHRVDQFAVGVVAYELLTGELPVGLAAPLEQRRPDLSWQLTRAVDKALAAPPSNRFATIAEFRKEFLQGAAAKPGTKQTLAAHPNLLRIAGFIALALILICTVGLARHRWDSHLRDKSVRTQDGLRSIEHLRADLAGISRRTSELRRRSHSLKEAAIPAGNVDEPLSEGESILAESALAEQELQRQAASKAWQWLSPQIDEEGVPYSIRSAISNATELLQQSGSDAFKTQLSNARSEIGRWMKQLEECESLHRKLIVTEAMLASPSPKDIPDSLHARWAQAKGLIDSENWNSAVSTITAIHAEVSSPLVAEFQFRLEQQTTATENWSAMFPDSNPPELEFLSYPNSKAKAASRWQKTGRYDRALPLLMESTSIIESWIDDVNQLHQRTGHTWDQIPPGDRIENPLGMRFVKHGGAYWSIWETRVMDFARFASKDVAGAAEAGEFWKNPGYPQGPTSPVVGIRRRVARAFAHWIPFTFTGSDIARYQHDLPRTRDWENLAEAEPEWELQPLRIALWTTPDEFDRMIWHLYHRDQRTDPSDWLSPVGLGSPSATGLYDLFGNAWEWCSELYHPKDKKLEFTTDPLGKLYGGGSFGETSWHGYDPPEPGMCFMVRVEAAGFRLIMSER